MGPDYLVLTDKGIAYKKHLEEELSQSEEGRSYLERIKKRRVCPDCDSEFALEDNSQELITCPSCSHIFINKGFNR